MRQDSRLKLIPKQPLKKNPKYKLRKLSIGVVSFLAGFAVFYGCSISASANEISPQGVGVVIEQSVNENKGIATKEQNEESASTVGELTTKTDNFSKKQKEEKEKRVEINENSKAEKSNDVKANSLDQKLSDNKNSESNTNNEENAINSKENSEVDTKTVDNTSSKDSKNIKNKDAIDKSNWPSMIPDKSNEGQPLVEGTGFRLTDDTSQPQENNNIIKVLASYYEDKPKVRININGNIKEYPMELNGNYYEAVINSPDNNLNLENMLNVPNMVEVIGTLSKSKIFNFGNLKVNNNSSELYFRGSNNKQPELIVDGDNISFSGNYDLLPIKLTNFKTPKNFKLALYVEYERKPGNESDPKVATNMENKIIFSNNIEDTQMSIFYIKTPYGYITKVYGLTRTPNEERYDIKLSKAKNGVVDTPYFYGNITASANSIMMVDNPVNGPTEPEFMNASIPTSNTVTYNSSESLKNRSQAILNAINFADGSPQPVKRTILGEVPDTVSNIPVNVPVRLSYADGSSLTVNVPVKVTEEAVTEKEPQLQKLGAWTDTNFAELPSNLGDKPASNQGSGKVIEYSAEEWNKSDNYNIFGWKPIDGGKVGIGKNGVNSVNIPPGNNLKWQNGYTGSNRISDNINQNVLILSNYADQDNYKGVFREVDVTNEREIGWKSITTGLSYPNSMNDNIKVRFIDVSKGTPKEIKSLIVNTNYVGQNDGVVQLPKGTTKVRVELVPTYNQINNWNSISQYNIDKNLYRFSSLVNAFELFRGSKMEDALLKSEKTQIFRNGEKGTYKFTIKNEGNGISGVNGRLPVAPYYGNGDAVSDSKLNAGVDLTFDEKIETESLPVNKDIDPNDKVVINLKPTLYSNGYNTSGDGVSAGETKELLLKTIDLTKKVFNRPTEIVVTDYKLNYGTKNPSLYYNLAQNTYINREGTANDTPYRQDVVANSEESAAKYGNQVTDKTVSNNATGRNIIILMNKTKLRDVITAENAKQLNRDDYTVESWTKYQAALARANDIINENETLENLSVDTATKLAAMASQSDIDNLAAELPKLLVKAPIVVAENNGNVTVIPAEGSVKLETTYNDGTNDITVESIKEEKSSTVEGETPTYSWKINNVIIGATQSENTPAGVSIDANTGKITILEKNIKDLSTVTAKDYSAENLVSKDASAVAKDITVPSAPTVTATDKSTVTIAPPSDNDVKSIIVNYTDSNDNNKTVIATKDKNGEWTIEGENSGVTVNIANGTITIPDGFIKADTEVTAKAKDISDNESIENRIRITYAQKYNPTVSGGSVSVNKDNVKTSEEKETLKTDILNKVTVPREAGNVTKEIQGDLPTTVGSHQVPVKVTYADGTEDRVNVTVDITGTQAKLENSGTMTEEQGNPGEGSTTTSVIGKKDSHVTVNKANQLPNTGYVTNVGMYGGLSALSAAGLLLGLKRRRKEEESNEE